MSDYLTGLIAKSLNTTAAVRPRLASRFEPQGVRAIFAEPQSPSEPAGGSDATTAAPSHAPATQLRRPVRRSARHSPVTEAEAVPTIPAQAYAVAQDGPAAVPRHVAAEQQRSLVLEPAVQQREIERTGLSKDPAPENASQPKVPRDRGISDVSPERVVLQPQVTPRVEPAPVAAPAPVSALTPTIQVTIGRIELRSNTLPPLPKPRPAPIRRGPALSLDAYLKQRNGGK